MKNSNTKKTDFFGKYDLKNEPISGVEFFSGSTDVCLDVMEENRKSSAHITVSIYGLERCTAITGVVAYN
jgi:hypothetical protein